MARLPTPRTPVTWRADIGATAPACSGYLLGMSETFEPGVAEGGVAEGGVAEGGVAEGDVTEVAAGGFASSRQVFDQRQPDLWARAIIERLSQPYESTFKAFDPTATTRAMIERFSQPHESLFDIDSLLQSTQKRFAELQHAIERRRRQLLPTNLHDLAGVTVTNLSRLADEGITLWHVPSPRTAQRLLDAPTYAARREILGRHGNGILRECRTAAANTVGGPYAAPARELETAIAAAQAGHVRPAISHIANVLDTLLRDAFESTERADLVRHKATKKQFVMDHFDDLDLRAAMVLRPIWFAYRPMYTREDRARSTSFARHAVAHGMTNPRVLSFRNLVQAAMLAAALVNYLTWWDEAR